MNVTMCRKKLLTPGKISPPIMGITIRRAIRKPKSQVRPFFIPYPWIGV
jgi:hypothetical protein